HHRDLQSFPTRRSSDLVLPDREWQVLPSSNPVFQTVFELESMPQIPALPFASPVGSTAEPPGAHKLPTGSMDEAQMRAWLDDDRSEEHTSELQSRENLV